MSPRSGLLRGEDEVGETYNHAVSVVEAEPSSIFSGRWLGKSEVPVAFLRLVGAPILSKCLDYLTGFERIGSTERPSSVWRIPSAFDEFQDETLCPEDRKG